MLAALSQLACVCCGGVEEQVSQEEDAEEKEQAAAADAQKVLKSEGETKEEDEEQNSSQLKMNGATPKAEEDDGVLFVEQKRCTVCCLEQPLRTKHCRSCQRCVATYDHHCPYLDNCVAEKNRNYFYWYLVFQQLQLAMGLFFVSTSV